MTATRSTSPRASTRSESGAASNRWNLSEELPALRTRIFIPPHSGRPAPVPDLRHVFAVRAHVMPVVDQLVPQFLPQVRGNFRQVRYAINDIDRQMKAVDLVAYAHIERRGRGAFFFVSAHMKLLVGAPVGKAVDQPRIAVIVEDDRLVRSEQRIVFLVRKAMRVFATRAATSSDRRR